LAILLWSKYKTKIDVFPEDYIYDESNLEEMQDTAIITCVFGDDEVRINATTSALRETKNQIGKYKRLFMELLFDDRKTNYPILETIPEITHITIRGNESNKALMQKESLYNLAVQYVKDCKYLIFVDSEMYSEDHLWFWKIREKLRKNPEKIIQGFCEMEDTVEEYYKFKSIATLSSNEKDKVKILYHPPGGCWSMTKEFFDKIGGWNPWGIRGCGDAIFLLEVLNVDFVCREMIPYDYIYDLARDIKEKVSMDFVDVKIIHINHGGQEYNWSRKSVEKFRLLKDFVEIDEKGLLKWKDKNFFLKNVLLNKNRMMDEYSTEKIIEKCLTDYQKIVHVINVGLFEKNERLKQQQKFAIESIEKSRKEYVTTIAAMTEQCSVVNETWKSEFLSRNAKNVLGFDKDVPFLKDVFNCARKYCEKNDLIVFTNSDCIIDPTFYESVFLSCLDVILLYRYDVFENPKNIEEILSFPRRLDFWGIDGIVIRAKTYDEIIDFIPNFLIGVPYWDGFFNKMSHRHIKTVGKMIPCLYHVSHGSTWSFEDTLIDILPVAKARGFL
jgi:hypothetical protein